MGFDQLPDFREAIAQVANGGTHRKTGVHHERSGGSGTVPQSVDRAAFRGRLSHSGGGRPAPETEEYALAEFEFSPPRPDQALLRWRDGPMKNKSNDPAEVTGRFVWRRLGSESQIGSKLLRNKENLAPGRGAKTCI